jgi:hypothetical protein
MFEDEGAEEAGEGITAAQRKPDHTPDHPEVPEVVVRIRVR